MQVVALIKFGERKEAQNLCASDFEAPKEKLCQELGHDAGSVDEGCGGERRETGNPGASKVVAKKCAF